MPEGAAAQLGIDQRIPPITGADEGVVIHTPIMQCLLSASKAPGILEPSTPAMHAKGRLQLSADADVVVFDLETLTDRAEFSAMNRPAEGVRHLLVSGQPVITDGVMDVAAATRGGRCG